MNVNNQNGNINISITFINMRTRNGIENVFHPRNNRAEDILGLTSVYTELQNHNIRVNPGRRTSRAAVNVVALTSVTSEVVVLINSTARYHSNVMRSLGYRQIAVSNESSVRVFLKRVNNNNWYVEHNSTHSGEHHCCAILRSGNMGLALGAFSYDLGFLEDRFFEAYHNHMQFLRQSDFPILSIGNGGRSMGNFQTFFNNFLEGNFAGGLQRSRASATYHGAFLRNAEDMRIVLSTNIINIIRSIDFNRILANRLRNRLDYEDRTTFFRYIFPQALSRYDIAFAGAIQNQGPDLLNRDQEDYNQFDELNGFQFGNQDLDYNYNEFERQLAALSIN